MPDSLDVMREIGEQLRRWLDTVEKFPDPPRQLSSVLGQLRPCLKLADEAVRRAPASLTEKQEWRDEVAAYVSTLRALRAKLGSLEITLRIQQAQAKHAGNHLDALRSWSHLARNIG